MMFTVCGANDLWSHGILEENLNVYFYVAFRPRRDATTQGYTSSCALQTREPVWFDTLRLEVDSLDGHAFLCVYVFAVPGDPRYETLDTLQDRTKGVMKSQPLTAVKKTPLELKLEGMRKAAAKRQREEQQKVSAQAALDAETGVRSLSSAERQWLSLKNYLAIVEKNQGIELHVPAVPEHHVPMGFVHINAKMLRHAVRTSYLIPVERGLQCGQGRMHLELEYRPLLLSTLDIQHAKILTPRKESFEKQVEDDFNEKAVEWLMPSKEVGKSGARPNKRGSGDTDKGGASVYHVESRTATKRNALQKNLATDRAGLGTPETGMMKDAELLLPMG